MSLTETINKAIATAMKAKEKEKLEALRAVKSALLLAQTNKGANGETNDEEGIKILQKLVKQRKESASIFTQQGRPELAEKETFEASIIEEFLPAQMSEEELQKEIQQIIASTGASTIKDLGKVMGVASKQLAGKADGKLIADLVKKSLS